MNKKAIVVEMPIIEGLDFLEIAKTFDDEQLSYVVALAKAYSDLEQELQRKDNIINELKKWTNSEVKRLEKCQNDKKYVKPYGQEYNNFTLLIGAYDNVLDKMKEIENGE